MCSRSFIHPHMSISVQTVSSEIAHCSPSSTLDGALNRIIHTLNVESCFRFSFVEVYFMSKRVFHWQSHHLLLYILSLFFGNMNDKC